MLEIESKLTVYTERHPFHRGGVTGMEGRDDRF